MAAASPEESFSGGLIAPTNEFASFLTQTDSFGIVTAQPTAIETIPSTPAFTSDLSPASGTDPIPSVFTSFITHTPGAGLASGVGSTSQTSTPTQPPTTSSPLPAATASSAPLPEKDGDSHKDLKIILPAVLCSVLVVAALIGAIFWLRRRKQPAAQPEPIETLDVGTDADPYDDGRRYGGKGDGTLVVDKAVGQEGPAGVGTERALATVGTEAGSGESGEKLGGAPLDRGNEAGRAELGGGEQRNYLQRGDIAGRLPHEMQ